MKPVTEFPITSADAFHLEVPFDHIGCLLILERHLAPEAVQAFAYDLVKSTPRLRASLDVERGAWRTREGFRVEDQLIIASPSSGGEAAILDAFANYYVTPLLESTPPWRMVHLPFVRRDGATRSALGFLVHHAFADGVRAFQMLRTAGAERPRDADRRHPAEARIDAGGWVRTLAASAGELVGRRATALPKGLDQGRRVFDTADIGNDMLRRAQHRLGISRTDILSHAFAAALCAHTGWRDQVRLMIPRDLGRASGTGGNRFIPLIKSFRCGAEPRATAERLGREGLAGLAAVNLFRLGVVRRLPRPLARFGYHRWADRFDALCTILPHGLDGLRFAGAAVERVLGVPPLIWRQPIAAAFVTGRGGADLLLAWDPTRTDASRLAEEVRARVVALAGCF